MIEANSIFYKKRWQITFYCMDPYGPKFSQREAAKKLKISRGMVQYWINIYQETKTVDDTQVSGRPWATDDKDEKKIDSILSSGKPISTNKIASDLAKKGSNVSVRTIRRRLAQRKVTYGPAKVKPLMNPQSKIKRLHFAKENIDRDWNNVIFTDEVTFSTYSYKRFLWRLPGSKYVVRSVKHPAKLHGWGCLCSKGFGRLYLFTKNLNADMMTEIYKKALIRSADMWFNETNEWVLQEDNDPKHRSNKAKNWKLSENVHILDWPSYSPDLNPIENVWGLLKAKIQENPVYDFISLVKRLKSEWKSLSNEYAQKLAESCSRIMQKVIVTILYIKQ